MDFFPVTQHEIAVLIFAFLSWSCREMLDAVKLMNERTSDVNHVEQFRAVMNVQQRDHQTPPGDSLEEYRPYPRLLKE